MRHGPVRHGAAARCGRPAKRRAPGPRMRTRRFLHLAAHRLTAPRPFTRPRAARLPPLPRLTGAARLHRSTIVSRMTDFTFSWGTRPAHRPTAPRPLTRLRAARLPPLPRLTGAAGPCRSAIVSRMTDFTLSLSTRLAHRPTASRPLTRPRRRSLAPLPRLTGAAGLCRSAILSRMTDFTLSWGTRPAHRPTAPRRNRVADDGLYPFVGYKARASTDSATPTYPATRPAIVSRMTDFTFSWGTRPVHRPTAPRPLTRPRRRSLAPRFHA